MKIRIKIRLRSYNLIRQLCLLIALSSAALTLQAAEPEIQVYKSATCGCCGKWVEHLRANGFKVTVTEVSSVAEYRAKLGVPNNLASCHTGVVNGYAVEGHVPAREIKKMLEEKPKAVGLAVPGMPIGSPGMEMGYRVDPYEVLLFDKDGSSTVYGKYQASK